MNTTDTQQQLFKFNKVRNSLKAVLIFTVINLVLTVLDVGIYFPFSATAPLIFVELGRIGAEGNPGSIVFIVCLGLALGCILLYLACFLLTKRWRIFVFVALVLFILDTLSLGWLIWLAFSTDSFELSVLLDVAFHIWILFSLIQGSIAWIKLRGVDTNSANAFSDDIVATTQAIEITEMPASVEDTSSAAEESE